MSLFFLFVHLTLLHFTSSSNGLSHTLQVTSELIKCSYLILHEYVLPSAGDLIYDALSSLHSGTQRAELADQIRDLMTDEKAPEKISMMSQYLEMLEMDVDSEERFEDEDWFDGGSCLCIHVGVSVVVVKSLRNWRNDIMMRIVLMLKLHLLWYG